MHSPKANGLPLPASPAGSGFLPRKEFLVSRSLPQHSFSLLAISSSSTVRLSNFPAKLISELRRFFDAQNLVRRFRENLDEGIAEFQLTSKFWSNPRAIPTEKLVVDILGIIFVHGFTFLSSIDYGRDQSDRLSLAFCHVESPVPPPPSQLQVPFAVSFPTQTTLRVISPPLHSTPAILQSVRTAWPRGVVSERKAADGCYEFKLKGYSWFSEDTFPSDSLHHILTLLGSLDKHDFKLITSLAVANGARARTKDLWIFSGVDSESPSQSRTDQMDDTGRLSPASSSNMPGMLGMTPLHTRGSSVPSASPVAIGSQHTRAATSPYGLVRTPSLLRKKAAVNSSYQASAQAQVTSKDSPSPPASAEASPGKQFKPPTPPQLATPVPPYPQARSTTPPSFPEPQIIYATPAPPNGAVNADASTVSDKTAPLLPSSAFRDTLRDTTFRDSAFSSTTGHTQNVPIAWKEGRDYPESPGVQLGTKGAWRDSGNEVNPRGTMVEQKREGEVKAVEGVVIVPEEARKSEMGLVGVVTAPVVVPPLPKRVKDKDKEPPTPTKQQGWVMVNVSPNPSTSPPVSPDKEKPAFFDSRPQGPVRSGSKSSATSPYSRSSPQRLSKTNPATTPPAASPPSHGIRSFFSRSKQSSAQASSPQATSPSSSKGKEKEKEKDKEKSKHKSSKQKSGDEGKVGVRQRWHRRGLTSALRSSRRLTIE